MATEEEQQIGLPAKGEGEEEEEEEEEMEEEKLSDTNMLSQAKDEKKPEEVAITEDIPLEEEKSVQLSEHYDEEMKGEADGYSYEQAEAKIHFPDTSEPSVTTSTTQEVTYEPEVNN